MKKATILVFLCGMLSGLCLPSGVHAAANPEQLPIPSEWIGGKPSKLDPVLMTSVESVLNDWKGKKEIILIDVRKRDRFEEFRIPGSINVPLFSIRTKTFLHNKSIVLINKGYPYTRLAAECRRLRKAGFTRAAVMFGGLWYWKMKGGPLEGDVFSQRSLNQVSAADFFEERKLQNQVVVNASEQAGREVLEFIPRTVFVPYRKKESEFISGMKNALRQSEHDPLRLVLIYNRDGRYPANLDSLLQKAGALNFYLLRGGLDGYRKFLQQQARMRWKKNEKKTIKKCPSCP